MNFTLQGLLRSRQHRCDSVLSISPGVPWTSVLGRALTTDPGRHVALVHDLQSGLAGSLALLPAWLQGALRSTERWSLQRADTITALTPEMGEAIQEIGVQRNVTTTPLWATIEAKAELVRDGSFSIQYSGNFGQKQGVDGLKDIIDTLAQQIPDLRVILRGAGERFEAVRQEMSALRTANVEFEAPVPDDQLAAALARSPLHLVLVAPGSGRFALPSKVVNSLAAGSLVLAMADSDSPLHRLARDLDGLIVVPAGDVDALVRAIESILSDGDLRDRRLHSQRQAASVFDRDRVLQGLSDLIVAR